jgi:uncharacterized membrane protein YjgN (DUF898 family)
MIAAQDEHGQQAQFFGRAGTLFGMELVNWLLALLTMSIYYFWGKTKVRRYIYSMTEFEGDRFAYHGTGKELFLGALKLLLLVLPLAAALFYFASIGVMLPELVMVVTYSIILLLLPIALYGARRYRLSRTSWRNVRFSFRGRLGECYKIYVLGVFLTMLTLSFYYPFFKVNITKYWMTNTFFGNAPLTYVGKGKDLFAIYIGYFIRIVLLGLVAIGGAVLIPIFTADRGVTPLIPAIASIALTLIGYIAIVALFFWWQAAQHRFHWGHTGFMHAKFYSTMSGGALLVLRIVHTLVLAMTLGLGFAWVRCDILRFHLSRVTLYGYVDFEQIVHDLEAAHAGAAGEGLMDALDIGDVDIGY